MDGTNMSTKLLDNHPPGNRNAAHHAWLEAEASDRAANFAAYPLARDDLLASECKRVFALHDSAQHHFITMLLWDRPGLGHLTTKEAMAEAMRHHEQVQTT